VLDGVDGDRHAPGRSITCETESVRIVAEGGLSPGPVWTDAENLGHTGIRSPDRPARSYLPYGGQ
jgi:hypothetical protein